ncbi:hypothetical protein ACFQ1S_31740, partial [Kibdelosporangium lantanae]
MHPEFPVRHAWAEPIPGEGELWSIARSNEATPKCAAFGQDIVDPLFPALVRELLHDPVFDMRLYTCFLIDATPFR